MHNVGWKSTIVNMLSCISFNARSLKNKLPDLHHILYVYSFDLLCICETWLSNSVSDAMLDPLHAYKIFRLDRPGSKTGGGVILFIKKRIPAVKINLGSEFASLECVCVDILNKSGSTIRVFTVYRKGGGSAYDKFYMNNLLTCFNSFCTTDVTCLIVGDINCPSIDWIEATVFNDLLQKAFFDVMCNLGFTQYVTEATRESNILDVILCNDPFLIASVYVKSPFSTSDHNSVEFVLNRVTNNSLGGDVTLNESCLATYADNSSECLFETGFILWKDADWQGLERFLRVVEWDPIFANCANSDGCWSNFCEVISYAIKLYVPHRNKFRNNSHDPSKSKLISHTKSYPRALKNLLIRKAASWRKYRLKRTRMRKKKYDRLALRCKNLLAKHESDIEKVILSSADLGRFYKYVNSKLSCKSGVGPLKNEAGEYIVNVKKDNAF